MKSLNTALCLTLVALLVANCGVTPAPIDAPTESPLATDAPPETVAQASQATATATYPPPTPTQTPRPTHTPTSTATSPPPTSTYTPSPTPTEEPPAVTQIVIDGLGDDWGNYQVVGRDRAGDQVPGSPDIAEVYAFNNDQYLYVLITLHADGATQNYDIQTDVDGGDYDYQISVSPGLNIVNFARYPVAGGMSAVDGVEYALDEAFEAKIPLAIVGGGPVLRSKISTWLGTQVGDIIDNLTLGVVNEVETLEAAQIEKPPTNWDMLNEFGDFQKTTLWEPALKQPMDVLVGPDGTIYIRGAGGVGGTVYRIDPLTGEVEVDPQLSQDELVITERFNDPIETDIALSPDGVRYKSYFQRGVIVRIEPDGSETEIVSGLNIEPIFIEFGPDGMLYIEESVYLFSKVSPQGGTPKTIYLVEELREQMALKDFGFDPKGRVIFADATAGTVVRIDLEAGTLDFIVPGNYDTPAFECLPNGDLVLGYSWQYPEAPSRIIILKRDGSETVLADDVPGVITALAVSPEGEVYGTSWDRHEREFWLYRVKQDGTLDMLAYQDSGQVPYFQSLDYDRVTQSLIGYDQAGERARKYPLDGSPSELIGPESTFAQVHEGRTAVDEQGGLWVLFVDQYHWATGPNVQRELYYMPPSGDAYLVTEPTLFNGCCTLAAMDAGPDGYAYLIPGPEDELIRVGKDGTVERLIVGLPYDSMALVVNAEGEIFLTNSAGVFVLTPIER
jgi:hypothetical protein